MTGTESGLALARRVLETEAVAIQALTNRLDERFTKAVQTLKEFGPAAKAALEQALLDPDPEVRRLAGDALLPMKDL